MEKVIIEYWDRISYISSSSEIKRTETWKGTKEEIFKRFDKENNRLKYCNGAYYKFEDETLSKEQNVWYNNLSENTKFQMYYGNGTVD
jgi:hypothetical protein